MRVSSESNRQTTDLQRNVLLAIGVDGIFGGSGLQPLLEVLKNAV